MRAFAVIVLAALLSGCGSVQLATPYGTLEKGCRPDRRERRLERAERARARAAVDARAREEAP